MDDPLIYFDNAATSWPKPEETYSAADRCSRLIGGNPGRSGHRLSIDAARVLMNVREKLARLIGAPDPFQIALTKNATEALNIALCGCIQPGDHVITTSMEHNSVMRPLRELERAGVSLTVLPCSPGDGVDPGDVGKAVRPNTRMLVCTHASNVTGVLMPVEEIGRITRERGVLFCMDAAQTAGSVPIDVERMGIDLLAVTGHKSLFGLQGTGALWVRKGLDREMRCLLRGGTGSRSEFEEQPDFMPDKLECGTPNTPGLAGLEAGLDFISGQGIDRIREKEKDLTGYFLGQISPLEFITVYGPADAGRRTPVVSFNIRGVSPSDAALFLDEEYGILSRPGLHCAPAAHRTIGTFPAGTVRFGFGFFNDRVQVDRAVEAICRLGHNGVRP